ncbi:MAG TPA: VanW family protein [Actinomycetota bacterium]|nr:VanW family protein [Actinomycetota bacterium]
MLPVLFVAAVVLGWSLDGGQNGRVARNVTLAGRPVGGLAAPELTAVVSQVAQEYAAAPVLVDAPQGGFGTDARTLGMAVQVQPTVDGTLALETAGPVVDRIWGWLQSFFTPRIAPVRITVDRNAVYRVVDAQDPGPRTEPTEPGIRVAGGRLEPVQGSPGTGIDPAQVIERLPEAAAEGLPIRVEVDRGEVAPRFTLEDARELVRQAEAMTAQGLAVKAGDQAATVPAENLRTWLRSQPTEQGLTLRVDHKAATAALRKLLDNPNPPPKNAAYDVVDGTVTIVPGQPGLGCCAETAGGIVEPAVLGRSPQPVELPVVEIAPEVTADELSISGIKEQVGTFTTNHAAGQPRVTNIHRIADMIRGQVIQPGATFSVNRFVGERTREKGFVVDAVIQDGKFEQSIGGGISQFATTLFNAAFFAGLEFPEYQSHSLYISRYPYGREATLSYPRPDLQIKNTTPYPVLIWPTYTRSSITVSLYSTKWVEAAQTGQTEERRGACKLVRTERTITYLADRSTKVDRVNALYRPAEGVNCS